MKNDRLFSGLVLLIIGAVFLLNNFGVIDFHWGNLFRLWPVFLIIGGINLLLSNTRAVWATLVRVAVLIIGLGFVLFSNVRGKYGFGPFKYNYDVRDDNDDDNDDSDGDLKVSNKASSNTYQQPFLAGTKYARLNVSGGATKYTLTKSTDSLFAASTSEYYGDYNLNSRTEDSVAIIDFDMNKRHQHFRWDGGSMNVARLSLNVAPIWDINIKGGAAKVDFDLTPYKVRNLNINGGAASCSVKLDDKLPLTDVVVSTGASEINISIPKNAACDIVTSSGLSSNDFEGFSKISGDHYTTLGFENAKNKIYLKLKGGVSDFNVHRY